MPESLDGLISCMAAGLRIGYIAGQTDMVCAQFGGRLSGGSAIKVENRNTGSVFGKQAGGSKTDPATAGRARSR